jgi:UDP-N-acetylmuramoyl-tripeptide--D-alanyl-D-alanine ligase
VEGVLPVFGTVNAINAAAAMAMAEALGVRREDALARIGAATLSPHRSRRFVAAGRTLIDDSYNANPASVREALGSLAATRGVRRIAVLGEMAELGADAVAMHREVLGVALESGLDRVVVLGASYAAAAEGAEDPRIVRFDREEPAEIAAWLQTSTAEGDVVLFKGSRSAALERILDAFVDGVADPVEGID